MPSVLLYLLTMKNMHLATCVFLLVFSLQLSAQENAPSADFSLTLERTGCEGSCPWYSVTILSDGSMHYEGKAYVHIEGKRKKTIPISAVQKLSEELTNKEFFQWEEKKMVCVDFPEARITATLNGQHKYVLEGCNSPGQVLTLADEIDRISGTRAWVGKVR